MNSSPIRSIKALVFLLCLPTGLLLPACGDDGLGNAFRPDERDDQAQYGEASPLKPGMEQWYHLITAYKRTAANDSGGYTQHEVQGSGHVCIKIEDVLDVHTEAYKDEDETLVSGQVKISGQAGDTSMFVSDQDNPAATPDEVDSLLSNLWLKRMVGPSSNHGFESPKSVTFRTHLGPIPTHFSKGLAIVPFFEIRHLPELNWSGWTSVGGELEGAKNLTNNILRYFQDEPFYPDFMAQSSRFKTKITTPPQDCYGQCLTECSSDNSCADGFSCDITKGACVPDLDSPSPPSCNSDHTCSDSNLTCFPWNDPTSCARRDCTWATPLESSVNSCMPLFRIGVAWRDTLRAPEIQAGNVLHFLEFMYYDNGTLYKATEDIRPDNLSPDLSANFPEATCALNCQSADFSIKGGFTDDPAYPAPCTF